MDQEGAAAAWTEPPASARNVAVLCHLISFVGYLLPLGGILGPLVVWLIKKDEHPYIDQQGKEALNFQVSILLYTLAALALTLLVVGLILLPAIIIFDVVMVIVAAIRSNKGEDFRYPLSIRLVS